MVSKISIRTVLLLVLVFCAIFPLTTRAAGLAPCVCQLDNPKKPLYCPTVFCSDTTNGFTTSGMCTAPGICNGQSTSGQNGGGGAPDMSSLMQALSSLMQAMQGGGGGGGGGGDQSGAGQGGCAQTYTVTAPSSDPCATYVPPVSGTIGTSGGSGTNNSTDLINSLLGGSGSTNTSDSTGGTTNPPPTTPKPAATTTPANPTTPAPAGTTLMHPVGPAAGLSGDIKVTTSGATVQVNNNDTKNNTVVAGFYGANSFTQPQGLAATWCKTRPWASNFLGKIIPTNFFDSLCTLRGFPVGKPAPPPRVATSVPRPAPRPVATTTVVVSTSTRPHIPPEVNIWAVPAKVPLGARTNIYWNTKGVDACTESSPDGSFTQNSLSGGAATVPLSGPTTYTISCITPSGDHVTNYTTVNMSI